MPALKENNLSKLYNFLQLGGKYTSQELSQKFNLSMRTIQIYLKELRENYGLHKEKRYYYFPDTYRDIDSDKRLQMGTALMIALYQQAIPTIHRRVLKNFKKIPKQTDAFLFDLDFETIENETYFTQMIDAIIHQKAIHFHYTDSKGETTIRNVYPIKLTNVLGFWYLMGYDLVQERVKTFYLNAIGRLVVSKDESYLTTEQVTMLKGIAQAFTSPWFNDEKKEVSLRIGGEAMLYVKRKQRREMEITKETEDYLVVTMSYYGDVEVLTFVKKWLPHIEILDNEPLRVKLLESLHAYLQK